MMKPGVVWTSVSGFIVQCGQGLKKFLILGLHNLKLDIPPLHSHSGMQVCFLLLQICAYI